MKTVNYGKVKIDSDLMAEFAICTGERVHARRIIFDEEQAGLITQVFNTPGCDRKKFAKMFQAKYGYGCYNSIMRWLKREGIELVVHEMRSRD